MKSLSTNTKGDTIIEVLIAIVILALVLTGAYVSSDASFKNIIDAEQRIQALDVAQSQVEDLREQASTNAFASYRSDNSCFQVSSNPNLNNVPIAYNASLTGPCVSQSLYLSEISYVVNSPIVPNVNEYKITVSWPSNNGTTSNVVLYYRVAI